MSRTPAALPLPHPARARFPAAAALCAALAAALAGCATFPEVDAVPPAASQLGPPVLLPIDPLLAQAAVPPRATQATADALAARADALRTRVGLRR